MKLLFDLFPTILFFATFKYAGIYIATAVGIAATILQVALYWFKNHRFENLHLVNLALISIFGGATILLHDENFIKWKPTVLNWVLGLVFLGSHWIGQKNLYRRMLEKQVQLPDFLWSRLNFSCVLFFFLVGASNLYVAYNYDLDTWVNFKLFGLMALTILFMLAQAWYLSKYIKTGADTPPP